MTDTPRELATRIIDYYGVQHQKLKLCEECGELIQALCKSLENEDNPDINADIVEEAADVEILITQLKISMGAYWRQEYDKVKMRKLRRQIERIKEDYDERFKL